MALDDVVSEIQARADKLTELNHTVLLDMGAAGPIVGFLLSIPVVVLIYSYVWSICTLYGILTRSTIASLLLTLLTWFFIFGIYAGETAMLNLSVDSRVTARECGLCMGGRQASLSPGSTLGSNPFDIEALLRFPIKTVQEARALPAAT